MRRRHMSMMAVGEVPPFVKMIKSKQALKAVILKNNHQPLVMMGCGSNTVFDDQAFNGCVLLNKIKGVHICEQTLRLTVASGESLMRVVKYCVMSGYSGIEALGGIPATIGGAVVTNAGAYGMSISDCIEEIDTIDQYGVSRTLHVDDIEWSYRWSSLREMPVFVTAVKLRLKKEDVKEKYRVLLKKKLNTQPWDVNSCGCFFKNKNGVSSGELIDRLDLKGFQMNGFLVSDKHANFFVNKSASTKYKLDGFVRHVARSVYDRYHVILEPEVHLLTPSDRCGIINLENYAINIS